MTYCEVPSTPTGVSASDGYCDKVRVSWNSVSGASSYKIYRNGSHIGNDSSSPYDDTSANPGTTYSYAVKATNDCGDSGMSSPDNGHRGAPPSTPTGVSASDGDYCDKVRVSWNSVSGASSYKIYRNGSHIGNDSSSPYDDTSANPGTTYSYAVKATNDCGDSGMSSSDNGHRGAPPSTPTGVSASDGDYCDKVRVSWNSVSGASSYKIYRNGSHIGNDDSSPYNDTSANPGTTYSYAVKATNDCGDSGMSSSNNGYRGARPSITQDPAPAEICSNQSHEFCVSASGSAPLSYQWQKNSSDIPGATSSCYTANTAGTYRCVVSNSCGTATSGGALLTVTDSVDWYPDDDGDSYGDKFASPTPGCDPPNASFVSDRTDCDDSDPAVNPGASEVCDSKDNDCDGQVDEGGVCPGACCFSDGSCDELTATECAAANGDYYGDNTDCSTIDCEQPPATGACCFSDGSCDELTATGCAAANGDYYGDNTDCTPNPCNPLRTWYRDADRDGFGNPAVSTQAAQQPSGYVANDDDCNDNDPDVNPDALDCANQPDGIDNDCNGFIDDDQSCQDPPCPDADDDGICDPNDLCPGTPAGESVDAAGCSCSQLDDDGDGVNNCDDDCPGTAAGAPVDSKGCPVCPMVAMILLAVPCIGLVRSRRGRKT